MNVSPLGNGTPVTRLQGSMATNQRAESVPEASASGQDTVEISDMARYLGEIKKMPDVRSDKVAAARSAIAAGTYETPAKLDVVASRMLEEWA